MRVLKGLFELRVELSLFLKDNFSINSLYEPLGSEDFVQGLAYLVYIFNHLYKINLSLSDLAVSIMNAIRWLKGFFR